eukprot:gene20265-52002_t
MCDDHAAGSPRSRDDDPIPAQQGSRTGVAGAFFRRHIAQQGQPAARLTADSRLTARQ